MAAQDQFPEFQRFRDTGCSLAPHCLDCPFIRCRYDLPPKQAAALLSEAEYRRWLATGLSVEAIAEVMGISQRTVFRLKHGTATANALRLVQIDDEEAG